MVELLNNLALRYNTHPIIVLPLVLFSYKRGAFSNTGLVENLA